MGNEIKLLSRRNGTNVCKLLKYAETSSNMFKHFSSMVHMISSSSLVTYVNNAFFVKHVNVDDTKENTAKMLCNVYDDFDVSSLNFEINGNTFSL